MGCSDEILHYSGVENGHSRNGKIAEKTSLSFTSRAKRAMNGCLVAVFLIDIGFICKKKLQEDIPETAWKNRKAFL